MEDNRSARLIIPQPRTKDMVGIRSPWPTSANRAKDPEVESKAPGRCFQIKPNVGETSPSGPCASRWPGFYLVGAKGRQREILHFASPQRLRGPSHKLRTVRITLTPGPRKDTKPWTNQTATMTDARPTQAHPDQPAHIFDPLNQRMPTYAVLD